MFGANPSPEGTNIDLYIYWTLMNQLQWNFDEEGNIFLENVHLKMLPVNCLPFWLDLHVLITREALLTVPTYQLSLAI